MTRAFRSARTLIAASSIVMFGLASNASAQVTSPMLTSRTTAGSIHFSLPPSIPAVATEQSGMSAVRPVRVPSASRPSIRSFAPIYVATAAMQMLDAHSTRVALRNGAVEANPFMAGLASNPAGLFAVKAAVSVGTIYTLHRLARKNRVAAIVTAVAINGAYAAIVAHNYRLAKKLR